MSLKIALIGAGAMGGAIGTRLLETEQTLSVFDLDPKRVAELTAKGAQAAPSAAEAAARSDYVITSLNSPKIVDAAVFGPKGVAEGAKPGTLIIDMSSIDPDASKDMAARAEQAGLRWVDSPLSGGAPKALIGELTLMAGGSEADVTDAHTVLRHVASNFTRMGPVGAGQTTKLINQVLCGLGFMAVAEATQLALDAGVDAERYQPLLEVDAPTAPSCRNTCRALPQRIIGVLDGSTIWSRTLRARMIWPVARIPPCRSRRLVLKSTAC